MNFSFSKYHGLGNDFILIEPQRNRNFDPAPIAKHLCDRHLGIGADGVVTITPLGGNSFEMRIFNSDGTETEMCGNATRCVAMHINKNRLAPGPGIKLHTRGGVIKPQMLDNGSVRVDMGEPRVHRKEIPVVGNPDDMALELELEALGRKFTATAVSMGNPHAVIFVPKVSAIELEKYGACLEQHPDFPRKVNVEFVEIISPGLVRMRVWERGCGVTTACGTGSCATAVAGVLTGRTERNLTVLLDGGELQIEYSKADNHVYMVGPAVEVFRGEYMER